jgi:UDP-glucose 4-epimerase
MTDRKVILVTGVAGYWGAQVATRLLLDVTAGDGPELHVIGLDTEAPSEPIEGLDFIQADVRNPYFGELLNTESVDTVCHLAFRESVRHTEANFDLNVIGTMKVLGACAEAGVKKVVLKSSMAVYGAKPNNPAFLSESQELQGSRKFGYNRHRLEIEAFCNGFQRQVPEMALTILRFPSIIGPHADTPMTRFLKQPTAPVLMGFDPRMQIIHERDAVGALVHATLHDKPGVYNIAAEEVLTLHRITGQAAKISIPVFHLFAYWGKGALNTVGVSGGTYFPIDLDYLRYPWVGDLEKMNAEFGMKPIYTAEETLREFAGEQRLRRYMSGTDALAYDEERLRDTLERRQRERHKMDESAADIGGSHE